MAARSRTRRCTSIRSPESGLMRPTNRPSRGIALLEVLLALSLLAIAGIASITFAGQAAHSLRRVRTSEQATFAAASAMERVAIRSAVDLDATTGRRRDGAYDITIARLLPELYDISISDTLTGATLLHSSVYSPYVTADTIK
jgi:Tfp pilus assembly protein PilV